MSRAGPSMCGALGNFLPSPPLLFPFSLPLLFSSPFLSFLSSPLPPP